MRPVSSKRALLASASLGALLLASAAHAQSNGLGPVEVTPGLSALFNPVITNPTVKDGLSIVGPSTSLNLSSVVPTTGEYFKGGGATLSTAFPGVASPANPILSENAFFNTTTKDANTAEYTLSIYTHVVTGLALPWITSTVYAAGRESKSSGNIYVTPLGGTAGVTPPSGTGTGINDGGVLWNYVGPATNDQGKVGLWLSQLVDAGAGETWNGAIDQVLNAGLSVAINSYYQNVEFDQQNSAGNFVLGANAYNVTIGGNTFFTSTAQLAITTNAGAGVNAEHFGVIFSDGANGGHLVDTSVIALNLVAPIGIDLNPFGTSSYSNKQFNGVNFSVAGTGAVVGASFGVLNGATAGMLAYANASQNTWVEQGTTGGVDGQDAVYPASVQGITATALWAPGATAISVNTCTGLAANQYAFDSTSQFAVGTTGSCTALSLSIPGGAINGGANGDAIGSYGGAYQTGVMSALPLAQMRLNMGFSPSRGHYVIGQSNTGANATLQDVELDGGSIGSTALTLVGVGGPYARLPNNVGLYGRNAGNSADILAISVDTSNNINIGSSAATTTALITGALTTRNLVTINNVVVTTGANTVFDVFAPNLGTGPASMIEHFGVANSTGNDWVTTYSNLGSNNVGNFVSMGFGGHTAALFMYPSGLVAPGTFALTSAAPVVAAGQIGLGSTVAATGNCGTLAGDAGCLIINVAGTTRYIPYY